MSGSQIGTVVGGVAGGVIGSFVPGVGTYAGAQLGMGIGGMIGGVIDPTKMYGPHVGDGQAQSATDGSPISWVMGTMWVSGTICDVGQRQEFKVKQSGGKGGPEQYSYEAHQNFSILVCESDELKGSTIASVLMVEQDGKIVYDVRPGSTMAADSAKWLARNCIFYYGDEAQLPTAADEAAHGVGNAPAYRGVLRAFFTQFNVTAVGDRIPQFRFLVASKVTASPGTPWETSSVPMWDHKDQYTIVRGYQDFTFTSPVYALLVDSLWYLTTSRVMIAPYFEGDTIPGASGGDNLGAYGTAVIAPVGTQQVLYDSGWRGESQGGIPIIPGAYSSGGGGDGYILDNIGQVLRSNTRKIIGIRVTIFNYFGRWNADQVQVNTQFLTPANITSQSLDGLTNAICARGGIDAGSVDTHALAGTVVQGYGVSKQMNAVSALGPLLGAHFAFGSEYDGKIHFDFYGKDAVMTIDEDDLLEANDANGNAVTANLRNNATEFPRRIVGQYYDPAQNYMPVTVMQTRRAAGITATGDRSFDIPVVMPADQAQQTVDKALKIAYAQLEGTLEFSVPFAGKTNVYLSLVPGDAVLFRGKRWIVTNPIISDGYIKLTIQYDRQDAYTSAVQAIPGLTPTAPLSRYSGPTTLIPMNLPALQTGDGYGLYLAAGPVDATTQNWRGCDVQMSLDSGATWQSVTQIRAASTYGALTVADTGTTLVAQVNDDLESVGSAQLDAQQNAAALLHGTAAEVLQFGTATEDSTTAHLYTLTTLRRHLLGTTQIAGAVDDKFVMLDNVVLLPVDLAFAGKTIQLRGVGFGEDADSATVVSIVYSPNTTTIHDGGTVT